MGWHKFNNGNTIGEKGNFGGVIVLDLEHELGARITIEKGNEIYHKLFCTSALIYGGYFSLSGHYTETEKQAKEAVEIIKTEFEKALAIIAKTPPKRKRNYETLSKNWLELYNLKLDEMFNNKFVETKEDSNAV